MNYPQFVRSRFKSGEKIAAEMTPHKAAALEFWSDVLVYRSNVLDQAKKYAIYNKEDFKSHQLVSTTLAENFKDFKPTPSQCELLHAAIGIAGEAGELLDAVRKHVFDGQPLDRENVIEELGDLAFYFQAALQVIGHHREWVEACNITKLSKRYEGGYSDQQAQERKDKQ